MAYGTINADLMTTSDGVSSSGLYGFKNRLINSAMVIDQRNAGASVTPANNDYTLDRWQTSVSQSSKLTIQQNAGSVTPPTGFSNYLGITSSSAYSIGASDYFMIQHKIEGFNTYDLGWGTASAATVTLSFWVRSSLTGTFGGVATNSATDRSYPFTYTISSANTWEQKSITIAGDTSGTWIGATNGVGIMLRFAVGVGSTYSGTAGSWSGNTYLSATGATSVVGTNGATFYITGVQLEKGSTATSFDYRPYGTELQLCQRYFQTFKYNGIGAAANSQVLYMPVCLVTEMRTTPSVERTSGSITVSDYAVSGYVTSTSTLTIGSPSGRTGVQIQIANGWSPTLNTLRPLGFSSTGVPANDSSILLSAEL